MHLSFFVLITNSQPSDRIIIVKKVIFITNAIIIIFFFIVYIDSPSRIVCLLGGHLGGAPSVFSATGPDSYLLKCEEAHKLEADGHDDDLKSSGKEMVEITCEQLFFFGLLRSINKKTKRSMCVRLTV